MTYSLHDWRAGVVPPKGWDCADAIDDGWTEDDVDAFLREAMVDELPYTAMQMYPEDFPERPSPHPMLRVTDPKRWRNYPYGHFTRADGSKVMFDRDYCPILSKSPTGHLEVVASDTKIDFVEQQWLYRSYDSPRISADTRRKVLALVEATGIEPELKRRQALVKRTKSHLPRFWQIRIEPKSSTP